jgi:hypothetical protein
VPVDFAKLASGDLSFAAAGATVSLADLRALTNQHIDRILGLVADATDADVVFVPDDPEAMDAGAPPKERELGWTLGHVVAHTTAGGEEGAATALTLARGAPVEGRPRYEIPWREITTIAQVRQRLEESRRMRLAMLAAWPDAPHLDTTVTPIERFGPMNAVARDLLGLMHENGHLPQIEEIMRQARAARNG